MDIKEYNEEMPISGEIVQDEPEVIHAVERPSIQLPDFLSAKTGEGSIEDYIDHPLNFNNSKPMARIIRGATGMLGALDLAIIDIGMGLLELIKGKKKVDSDVAI